MPGEKDGGAIAVNRGGGKAASRTRAVLSAWHIGSGASSKTSLAGRTRLHRSRAWRSCCRWDASVCAAATSAAAEGRWISGKRDCFCSRGRCCGWGWLCGR